MLMNLYIIWVSVYRSVEELMYERILRVWTEKVPIRPCDGCGGVCVGAASAGSRRSGRRTRWPMRTIPCRRCRRCGCASWTCAAGSGASVADGGAGDDAAADPATSSVSRHRFFFDLIRQWRLIVDTHRWNQTFRFHPEFWRTRGYLSKHGRNRRTRQMNREWW